MNLRANKYGRKKVTDGVRSYDSKLERAVGEMLWLMEKAGEIEDLKFQVEVRLTRANVLMKPDFSFLENGVRIYLEAKGFPTPVYNLKKRLWKVYGPGELRVYGGSYKSFKLIETVYVKP